MYKIFFTLYDQTIIVPDNIHGEDSYFKSQKSLS